MPEVTKILGEKWKGISDERRANYQRQAAELKAEYDRVMQNKSEATPPAAADATVATLAPTDAAASDDGGSDELRQYLAREGLIVTEAERRSELFAAREGPRQRPLLALRPPTPERRGFGRAGQVGR